MAKITYQPTPDDLDTATVDGVDFAAYEPVELDDGLKADLINKLKRNPWFTDGAPDADRHASWATVRGAQAEAKAHREQAEALERDPAAVTQFTSQAQAHAQGLVDGATARAGQIVADAQAQADKIVADAHAQAAAILADAKNHAAAPSAPAPETPAQPHPTSTQAGGNA